jgi:hypothetical protein
MFKKIHSNRDPGDTLYSELKKEFSAYVDKGDVVFKSLVCGYPRFVFGLMIALLIASLILAVALHKILPEKKVATTSKNVAPPINEGFDNIMAAGVALKQTIRLRRQVDSITARKTLTKSDSLILLRDLDSLQHIRINLPH